MGKLELRRRILAWREKLSPRGVLVRSSSAVARILSLEVWGRAGTVLLYYPWRNEVDATGLANLGRKQGKDIFLPKAGADGRMVPVLWDAELVKGLYGIPVPLGKAYSGTIDLVIVPGVAYDGEGHRLGYGGGYYDRYLAGGVISVGLAYEEQVVEPWEREYHDVPVHMLITDGRIIKPGKA